MDFIQTFNLDEQLNDPLDVHHSSCFYCNGYYGPNFGEPVCATCHEFLFSEDLELFQRTVRWPGSWFGEKDDGDSGNDEPSEEAAGPSNRAANNVGGGDPYQAASPPLSPAEEDEEMELAVADPVLLEPPEPGQQNPDSDEPMAFVQMRHFFPGIRVSSRLSPPSRPQDRLNNQIDRLTLPRPLYETIPTSEDMSLRIPPEIWAVIFRKLDDISLLLASKVSRKWKAIVLDQNPNSKWKEYVELRWPLFHPIYIVTDWYAVYCDFIDSVPCKLCFINLALHLPFDDFQPVRSLRSVRLHKELKWLRVDHPEGIEAIPLDELNYNWLARISGPPQSPYQGAVFYLNLKVPHDYPLKPPVVRFLTRILHPNVSRHGDIGIDCILHNWTLALTIPQILLSVQSLLTDPYLPTNMEPEIANLYSNDRPTFDKIARIYAWKYAMHDVLVH
ncbi:uncharacterized protein LOC110841891 [Folsomia candida]|uniref:E2 ubiquitin-conjugating enzyme n=1 Tax=Folsomia candida TaxID=158441 RepID=A0A226F6Z0_FOLCA|nr:uncharacterized protein LOC110841891 [Folsomia candida]OXA65214.1 Ubiquitin-conjugating enzyme E2 2 [Folsomia candida]